MSTLGETLRKARLEAHISQIQLARIIGVSNSYVSHVEKGNADGFPRRLSYEHLRLLPDPIRGDVVKAAIEESRADIAERRRNLSRLRALLNAGGKALDG